MVPTHTVGAARLYQADCRDVLRSLPDNSVDSVCTDPPYALVSITKRFGKPGSAPAKDVYGRGAAGFMGKTWDTGEVAFSEEFWAEVLRVLKPGGHVVAFSGTRTYHRMAVAIEDAGFEIRDQLGWLYGSGFPKSHDVSKGIDKAAGAERPRGEPQKRANASSAIHASGFGSPEWAPQTNEPQTAAAAAWQGWGTALKPAWEPICLARKPLDGTVAANVLEHGTGALNIDGCRVGTEGGTAKGRSAYKSQTHSVGGFLNAKAGEPIDAGRWPANIVHDGSDEVLAAFPETTSGTLTPDMNVKPSTGWSGGSQANRVKGTFAANSGSAARFFYCAKASRRDRDEGLEDMEKRPAAGVGALRDGERTGSTRANTHPTVKPTELMRWLCRLVTPPGGLILDPFMGSGSTGKAALLEGFRFIGCEREDEYMPIARARIAAVVPVAAANDNEPVQLALFA